MMTCQNHRKKCHRQTTIRHIIINMQTHTYDRNAYSEHAKLNFWLGSDEKKETLYIVINRISQ